MWKARGPERKETAYLNEGLTARQRLTSVLVDTLAGGGIRALVSSGSAVAN